MKRDLCVLRVAGSVVLLNLLFIIIASSAIARTTATPTPSGTPTPVPPGHYSMLGPDASLNTEADCVTAVNASPITTENAPWNSNDGTGWNSNLPPENPIPSYFMTMRPAVPSFPNQISVASMAIIQALLMT